MLEWFLFLLASMLALVVITSVTDKSGKLKRRPLVMTMIAILVWGMNGFLFLGGVYERMPRYWADALFIPITIISILLMVLSGFKEWPNNVLYSLLLFILSFITAALCILLFVIVSM
ncbi:hypothetical protein [Bacillus sp. 1P06AnD]|uniref:hypothetical protein n=1 Tax=Bacillus sp. 1P06AnD TaxID=3132208 RepID=UPI0039A1755C